MATSETTTPSNTLDNSSDLVISLIEQRTADPSPYSVEVEDAVENALETRRVYDFRLPRGHIGRRRPRMVLS